MTERRDFFKRFFSELYHLKEEANGKPHFKLADLWKLDDDKFRQIKLRVREGVAIHYGEEDIYAVKEDNERVFMCAVGTSNEQIFHLLQQRKAMGEIIEQLAEENNVEQEVIFQAVRAFALSLVKPLVCVPANNIVYEKESKEGVL